MKELFNIKTFWVVFAILGFILLGVGMDIDKYSLMITGLGIIVIGVMEWIWI